MQSIAQTKNNIDVNQLKEIKKNYTPSEFIQKVHQRIVDNELIQKALAENPNMDKEECNSTMMNEDEANYTKNAEEWVFLKTDPNLAIVEGDLVVMDPEALGSMFIWIEDSDVIDAIAYCVAQSIVKMPRIRNLPYGKLQTMVDGAFWSIKEKCLVEQVYDWGKFMYSVYGWSAMAYSFVTQPAVMIAIAETTVSVLLLIGF